MCIYMYAVLNMFLLLCYCAKVAVLHFNFHKKNPESRNFFNMNQNSLVWDSTKESETKEQYLL